MCYKCSGDELHWLTPVGKIFCGEDKDAVDFVTDMRAVDCPECLDGAWI